MSIIKKLSVIVLLTISIQEGRAYAQATSSFNFTKASHTVSGWINVAGDPSAGVLSGTDATTGISVSSVATGNWSPYSGGGCAFDGGGASGGTFFPSGVMVNHWYQYDAYYGAYNALVPQLILSGLNVDSVYTIKMTGSFIATGSFVPNPVRYTVTGSIIYGYVDVDADANTITGAVFNNIAPDATGKIKIYVNTYGGSNVASICGLQIIRQHTAVPTPAVSITSPKNNNVLPEDGNFTINASASETGGSINKVEFYADTTLIGVDSTSPYSITWVNPDEGNYTLKARAIDGLGNTSSSTINVSVESLNTFWSLTGNIATNADSFFVGTVDSNRLAFRTKNIERLSISPTGLVGIGIIHPTAQLHTTGTVRLAGLTADSTKTRVLVSDTSGNLFYRDIAGISGSSSRWSYAGGTVYDSADNIGIGTSNTQGYKLAVNGTAIFTKVKVKTAGTWPDYVFEKGYNLPDLAELEQYLALHKHLPDITPAAEAQKDGIDVAGQQAALLKKVEELTLYLIDENKQLKAQVQQMQSLQQQMDELKKLIGASK